jgi:hypothetical protein
MGQSIDRLQQQLESPSQALSFLHGHQHIQLNGHSMLSHRINAFLDMTKGIGGLLVIPIILHRPRGVEVVSVVITGQVNHSIVGILQSKQFLEQLLDGRLIGHTFVEFTVHHF